MKMVVAIVQNRDSSNVVASLNEEGYRATKLASTGGLLREGNTTLLVGVDTPQVDDVLKIIKQICQPREQQITRLPSIEGVAGFLPSHLVTVGGATVFILDVEGFVRI